MFTRPLAPLALFILFAGLAAAGAAADLPNVDFATADWKFGPGISRADGVLSLTGDPAEYRKALLHLPVDELPAGGFYFTAEIKTENVVKGPHQYSWPKFKLYHAGASDTREASWISISNTSGWLRHTIFYRPRPGHPSRTLVLEIGVENCAGTLRVRQPSLILTAPEPDQTFPYAVPAKPECRLQLDTAQVRRFNDQLLGLNSHFMGGNPRLSYADERIQELIGQIKVPLLRFPGGTVANWYDYETDLWALPPTVNPEARILPRLRAGIAEGRKFGFAQHLALAQRYGFATTLVLNVLHDSTERCVARVQDRRRQGLVFPWVELGNENYDPGQQSLEVNTVEKYIEKCRAVTAALHAAVPDLIVAINIPDPNDPWSVRLAKEDFYDAVVLHPYSLCDRGPVCFGLPTMIGGLTAYAQLKEQLALYAQVFGQKPLLLTEWGVLGGAHNIRNHLAALATADMFFGIIDAWESGPAQTACLHIFSDGFMGLYDSKPDTNELFKRPYAVVYDQMIRAFLGAELLAAHSTATEMPDMLNAAQARAARGADGRIRILAVNKLPVPTPLTLEIDGQLYSGPYTQESFANTDLATRTEYPLDQNPCIVAEHQTTPPVLAPYSVTLFTLEK